MDGYSKYYQKELYHLRELAKEFAEVHPAIAPMLSGQASDPDVERLLEGNAFLSGLLRQKIDDHLPEVIHALSGYIFPHFLKTIPSVSLVSFVPKKGLQEPLKIKAGAELKAEAVNGVSPIFQTSSDCLVQPIQITSVTSGGSGVRGQHLEMELRLTGPSLDSWIPEKIPFFIGGSYSRAADIFYLITRKLKKITAISGDGEKSKKFAPEAVQATAFKRKNSLFPFPGNSFIGYRYLQEYFLLPHKFLCFDLIGLDGWLDRGSGDGFSLKFEFDIAPVDLPPVNKETFLLSTVPVINLFNHDAEPVVQDHKQNRVRITPSIKDGVRPDVYSVETVTGYSRGAMEKREYKPVSLFSSAQSSHVYSLHHSVSAVHNKPQLSIEFAYPPDDTPVVEETLSVNLTCTNGDLPQQLKVGDIHLASSTTPELVEFVNIMRPTLPIDPPLTGGLLWKLISHLSLNLLSLGSVESLVELLEVYIFRHDRDKGRISSNEKRIQGIEEFTIDPISKLFKGQMIRGQKIGLVARGDHFASPGDFCLFGMILDHLFAEYCSMNTFTQFELIDSVSGERYTWPTRLGSKALM